MSEAYPLTNSPFFHLPSFPQVLRFDSVTQSLKRRKEGKRRSKKKKKKRRDGVTAEIEAR